jgi:hypothetical protein
VTLTADDDWVVHAACGGVDAEAEGFFPDGSDRASLRRALDAISGFCARCPVRTACLIDARRQRDVGVRGGVLRAVPASSTGNGELNPAAIRERMNNPRMGRGATHEPDCSTCGRHRIKKTPAGKVSRHLDYSTGEWCPGPPSDEDVA